MKLRTQVMVEVRRGDDISSAKTVTAPLLRPAEQQAQTQRRRRVGVVGRTPH